MYRMLGGIVLLIVDTIGATISAIEQDWAGLIIFVGLGISALFIITLGHQEWHSTD